MAAIIVGVVLVVAVAVVVAVVGERMFAAADDDDDDDDGVDNIGVVEDIGIVLAAEVAGVEVEDIDYTNTYSKNIYIF